MSGPQGYTSLFRGCIAVVALMVFVVGLGFIFMAVPR